MLAGGLGAGMGGDPAAAQYGQCDGTERGFAVDNCFVFTVGAIPEMQTLIG